MRTIEVAGHAFEFTFCRDFELTEKPPIFRCSVIVDVALSCDIHVIVGLGGDSAMRDRFWGSYRRGSVARGTREIDHHALGITLPGLRFEGLEEFGPDTAREVYMGPAGDDLVVFSYTINRERNPHEDAWRQHLVTLVVATMTSAPASG